MSLPFKNVLNIAVSYSMVCICASICHVLIVYLFPFFFLLVGHSLIRASYVQTMHFPYVEHPLSKQSRDVNQYLP